jgi:hypothetical protein
MNNNDLKHTLRPLIKECVKEVIFEEGFLSGIVTEVLIGVQAAGKMPIVEQKTPEPLQTRPQGPSETELRQRDDERKRKMRETRQQMAEAIGREAYNGIDLFEGTEPLSKGGTAGRTEAPAGALSGVDPNDSGVNLDAFFGASQNWSKMV